MSLLSVHADVLESLRRLGVPFEIVSADALGDGERKVVAVSAGQRDVLLAWGVPVEDVHPDAAIAEDAGDTSDASPGRRRAERPDTALNIEQAIIREALAKADAQSK
jgi:hypothetical protein